MNLDEILSDHFGEAIVYTFEGKAKVFKEFKNTINMSINYVIISNKAYFTLPVDKTLTDERVSVYVPATIVEEGL
jgi:hypothetical protein